MKYLAKEDIGLRKGESIGFDKGELKSQFTIAKTMLKNGFPLETVAKMVGLSVQDLQES